MNDAMLRCTKQGYPDAMQKREVYPGGYPMVYDPQTGETKVYPIPVAHHGINSITSTTHGSMSRSAPAAAWAIQAFF